MDAKTPTIRAYTELQQAYDFFNKHLFNSELPNLIITLQRGKNTLGYFSPERFTGESNLSELAMNPDYFGSYPLIETLSTLAHEMVHVWQHYMPVKKARRGYHDKVWGAKMEEIGLMPSSTGKVGGKKTGQKMNDYIIRGGKFQAVVYQLLEGDFSISWYDRWGANQIVQSKDNEQILHDWLEITDENNIELKEKLTQTINKGKEIKPELDIEPSNDPVSPPIKGSSTRTKFTCPECGLNAWAKPTANIQCGDCKVQLESI